jgi:hypothetical protein
MQRLQVNLEATRVLKGYASELKKNATLTIASDGTWGNGNMLKMTGNTVIEDSTLFHAFGAFMSSLVLYIYRWWWRELSQLNERSC